MDSPRLDATRMLVGPENGAIMVTLKPKFVWVDLTTRPGLALTYSIDTDDCWGSAGFDQSKARLHEQLPRTFTLKVFNREFRPSNVDGEGQSGVYYHSSGIKFAMRMKCNFCVHNFEQNERPAGDKGDWLVTNGQMNMPVARSAFEQKFVRVDSFSTDMDLAGPNWQRDGYGFPITDKRRLQKPNNVIPFKRRDYGENQLEL